MGEDADAARAKLERQARDLRAKRLKDEQRAARAEQQAHTEERQAFHTSSWWRVMRSMSNRLVPWTGFFFLLMTLGALSNVVEPGETPASTSSRLILAGLSGACWLYYFSGAVRFWLWRARLPFQFVGHEVLGLGGAVTSATLRLTFRDGSADLEVLRELVRARLPDSTLESSTGPWALSVADLDCGVTNHALGHWLRRAVRRVLLDAHRAYPLERVELVARKVEPFHVEDMS